jgi:endogenous inhibitor of DNA gyrase (YacG/DUF329 family)
LSIATGARQVPCPRCRGLSLFSATNRWRPFCSERCASIDLGAWASEAYRVPARPPDPTEPDGTPVDAR